MVRAICRAESGNLTRSEVGLIYAIYRAPRRSGRIVQSAHVKVRRIVDLHQWAQNHFHHPGTRGRTSIKPTLDALWRCDETMRAQFEEWTGLPADPSTDPYASLPPIEINGVLQDVVEGTGAVRAYEAMMYGVEKNDPVAKAAWRELLLQYCKLDTLSMLLIFEHWRRGA